jgi:hypothetical protein
VAPSGVTGPAGFTHLFTLDGPRVLRPAHLWRRQPGRPNTVTACLCLPGAPGRTRCYRRLGSRGGGGSPVSDGLRHHVAAKLPCAESRRDGSESPDGPRSAPGYVSRLQRSEPGGQVVRVDRPERTPPPPCQRVMLRKISPPTRVAAPSHRGGSGGGCERR